MLRDNSARARTARLLFLLFMLVAGGVALFSLVGLGYPGWGASDSLAPALLMAGYGLLMMAEFLLSLAVYVVLIMWLRRAYYNLHQLPGIYPAYSDGWAAGAWFVPFINVVRPYTITREVWDDTQRAALGQVQRPATVLGWWWAAYLLKLVAGQLLNRLINKEDGISATDMQLILLDSLANFAFAALSYYVIGQVAGFEKQLQLRQQVNQLGQEPASPLAALPDQSDYALEEGY